LNETKIWTKHTGEVMISLCDIRLYLAYLPLQRHSVALSRRTSLSSRSTLSGEEENMTVITKMSLAYDL